jgi:hypothetical protein
MNEVLGFTEAELYPLGSILPITEEDAMERAIAEIFKSGDKKRAEELLRAELAAREIDKAARKSHRPCKSCGARVSHTSKCVLFTAAGAEQARREARLENLLTLEAHFELGLYAAAREDNWTPEQLYEAVARLEDVMQRVREEEMKG